jgi:enhancing lycopene biosynthesis protein 2
MSGKPVFAVVLCGSGRADGSEIHESVSVLIHLARLGVGYQCFAPDQPQADVVDHHTGRAAAEVRNCLHESARISRGASKDLRGLHAADYAGVIFPGGFGAAKNLCDFAVAGAGMRVHPEVERVIREFRAAGKPMGLCCIAPVLAAKVLGSGAAGRGAGVTLTLGPAGTPAAEAARQWGATHEPAGPEDVVVDRVSRVATTPAYMHDDANPHQVFVGIGKMVEAVVRGM